MKIITRTRWLARPANRISPPMPHASRVQIHHSVTAAGKADVVRSIQEYHLRRGWADIAYSFLVDRDGEAYEGRGRRRHGNSAPSTDLSICAVGNFDTGEPPQAMVDGITALVAHGALAGWWDLNVLGHRDVPGSKPTACPGRFLYGRIPEIRANAQRAVSDLVAPQEENDDMPKVIRTPDSRHFGLLVGVDRYAFVSNAEMELWRQTFGEKVVPLEVWRQLHPAGAVADIA